jgi:hypothetical protein
VWNLESEKTLKKMSGIPPGEHFFGINLEMEMEISKLNAIVWIQLELFQNPAVLGAIQSRLNTLVGQSSGYVEALPEVVQRRLRALQNIQDKNLELENKFRAEVLELEKKYHALHQPLYDHRALIVAGTVEPSDAECERPLEEDDDVTFSCLEFLILADQCWLVD